MEEPPKGVGRFALTLSYLQSAERPDHRVVTCFPLNAHSGDELPTLRATQGFPTPKAVDFSSVSRLTTGLGTVANGCQMPRSLAGVLRWPTSETGPRTLMTIA